MGKGLAVPAETILPIPPESEGHPRPGGVYSTANSEDAPRTALLQCSEEIMGC